ncbi:cyclodeaminase/cyclohydrolase family protein [Streptomyces sp. CB02488]|uniref:cyclodeaminase/cyclohydrolase family protein n=1 Tax=Streptomyces sp. CB02488 TaxID=1703920 RepID=UPI0009A0E073|nr:cyclodeaminase/cyclohydrolase family protein [Streptomyces sp. CB02488]
METPVRDESVGGWLDDLASASFPPGAGAAAAMNIAVGAALISMVCNHSLSHPKCAAHTTDLTAVQETAENLRSTALGLAADDAVAFSAVLDAHRLPRATATDTRARATAVQEALTAATEVPLRMARTAAEVVRLARRLIAVAKADMVPDLAVAASSARAALDTAAVIAEVNLSVIADTEHRSAARLQLVHSLSAVTESEAITAEIRARYTRREPPVTPV